MKICIATATRAEYGLLKPLMDLILADHDLYLQLLVTGAHLSPEFGLTYRQIEADGLHIDLKVDMLLSSDSPQGITKSMGLGLIGFADAFEQLKPDLLVLLGDRYEMLAMAAAALMFRIPVAHLHGGEITEGAYDDAIRHAISKMSHLHFTATEAYRQRVIQLGEQPQRVFNVGAIGLDAIRNMTFLSPEELAEALGLSFKAHNYVVAFHPETLSAIPVTARFEVLLEAIQEEKDSFFVFTGANADTHGRVINQMMETWCHAHPEISAFFPSLGSLRFLSLLRFADAIIGNSSSGIIEAPSLHTATINIGDRQKGRTQAGQVFSCGYEAMEIRAALVEIKTPHFQESLSAIRNPYGDGGSARKILDLIKQADLPSLHLKSFYNLDHESV